MKAYLNSEGERMIEIDRNPHPSPMRRMVTENGTEYYDYPCSCRPIDWRPSMYWLAPHVMRALYEAHRTEEAAS
jgi:hypothetical protein